jgi:uncharacterized 2Fe-2S/4Fe-4S cluster protein (DUF4445 family)
MKASNPDNRQSKNRKLTVKFLPFDISVDVQSGTSILDAAKKAHLPLKIGCGGKGTCGECVVQILSGNYKHKPTAALTDSLVAQGYALACQVEITDNIDVQLPRFQELTIRSVTDFKFFDEQNISGFYEVDPPVKKFDLQIPSPSLENNYSDLKRVEQGLQKKIKTRSLSCEYSVLKKLAQAVRRKQGQISLIILESPEQARIMDVFPQNIEKRILGLACDIGTSTVSLHLVDLQNGKIMGSASSLNQQIKCGEDIISRINYAQNAQRLLELHRLVIGTINHLIKQVTQSKGISSSDIYYGSFSGNTTMIHLFLNLEPRYIREEPYVPTVNQVPEFLSRNFGLNMNHECRIHISPSVGSYVGGDITAGLLCTPILRDTGQIFLFIDAGTNGELVVGNKDWLMTCACSAGPAFEGSGIKCGMPASEGAIEKIEIKADGELLYQTINGTRPKGLCGSGLVDLLAGLFIHGYIDRHGKFKERRSAKRMVKTEEGKGFLIEEAKNCFWNKDIVITENDISNLIRTKGAVFSACSVLLKNVGLSFNEIDSIYIAGGFGQRLNIENAIRIGLLPDLDRERFHYIGNSSLHGAYLILLSGRNKDLVNEISEKMTYIELNTEPQYMNEYTAALFLPHTDMNLFPSVRQAFNP